MANQIVGASYFGGLHGFVLDTDGSFTAIDVPGASGTFAYGINDSGQIVGYFHDGVRDVGFLASPVPEPPGSLTLVAGLVALCAIAHRRKRVSAGNRPLNYSNTVSGVGAGNRAASCPRNTAGIDADGRAMSTMQTCEVRYPAVRMSDGPGWHSDRKAQRFAEYIASPPQPTSPAHVPSPSAIGSAG
jgi:hypothetical protein